MDSAPKDDVSNDEQIDDVAAGPATTPDPEAKAPMFDKEQYVTAQEQWAKMVKANEELIAQAKVNSDLLISVRKEAANHALAAKMALEHAQDMINDSYIGGKSYLNLLVVQSPLQGSHLLKDHESRSLLINLYPMHKK